MKILLVCNHYLVSSGRYMTDALTRLGHEVTHVGPARGSTVWGMNFPRHLIWDPQEIDFREAPRDSFDLILVADSDPAVLDGSVNLSRRFDAPVVVYGVDNHVRDYRRPWIHHYFLSHYTPSLMPWNGRDMSWLPCARDPVHFQASSIPWESREYDVVMIGVLYPDRLQWVRHLQSKGLKVLAGTGLVYQDFARAHHKSRVSLVVSPYRDLSQRVFETAGMGNLVVSGSLPDLSLFDAPHPIHEVSDPEEAFQAITYLQSRPDLVEKTAEWAQPHTWDSRLSSLIERVFPR